jgi:hypothetical protein
MFWLMKLSEEIFKGSNESAKFLFTSQQERDYISLYRLDKQYYLVHYDRNNIIKTEKISKALAHLKFPNLIVR